MQQTTIVTGGAGFIGSHLVDAFVAEGHRVLVVDDLTSGREDNLPPEAELHVLDIRSPQAADLVERSRASLLVHEAAQIDVRKSIEDPAFDADVNVVGSLNLIEAARRGRIPRVLFASTGGAIYGEQETFPAAEDHPERPLSAYGVAKLAVERYLYVYHRTYGIDATCLRYANVYGERQNPHGEAGVVAIFLDRLLSGTTPVINGDGSQTRDYVHVSDVVRANVAAAHAAEARDTPGFDVWNVGTATETSVVELFEALRDALGSDARAEHGPAKPGEQERSVIDPTRILAELSLPRPMPLEEGLARTAAWFHERHQSAERSRDAAAAEPSTRAWSRTPS